MSWLGELLSVFATTILPVLLVAAAGYVLAWFVALDGQTLGRILFYLASPALVFRSLYRLEISATTLGHEVLVVTGVFAVTGLLGWAASRGQTRSRRSGFVMASAIGNTGNMGIPISLFALGDAGFALATLYYAITTFLTNSAGVVIASAGSAPPRRALMHLARAPVLYAVLLAFVLNRAAVPIPAGIYRAIDLLADASIPGMLVLLGMQLRTMSPRREDAVLWRSVVIRLAAAPLVALALCWGLGIGGVERQVFILQAAMPTAVVTTVLATEFAAAPRLVAAAVLVSTLASMFTVSLVLVWLT
jgi:hypothetical protein